MSRQQPVTKRSLGYWVRNSDRKLQLVLLLVVVVTVFARVLPLEMQKRIVNEAINMRKLDLLFTYCAIFAVSVLSASGLKYAINLLQTRIGERALANLRKELYAHIITLPVPFYRKTPSGMVISALVTELSSVGDFVGMAVAVPITNLLTLGSFAAYLFYLNPILGAVSLAVYPLALAVVPRLQGKANEKNKQRVDRTREMSNTIGEAVRGIHEIHGHGSYALESAKFDAQTESLFGIRILWNLYRYGAKVLNNFFVNLGPLIVFVLGGYLSITGRLDLGALVAFLSAQEKLYDPWKELIDFYQLYQDATVRYARTMEAFDIEAEGNLLPQGREALRLEPSVDVKHVNYVTDSGLRLLSDVSVTLAPGELLALVGFSGSGKSTLAMCVNQLYHYSTGHVTIGGQEVEGLTKLDLARNVGYVAQSPLIFNGSIRDNLVYAVRAANNGDADSAPSRDDLINVLQQSGLFSDVLRFGLRAKLPQADTRAGGQREKLPARLVRIRAKFQEEFGGTLADFVEFFDPGEYLRYATVRDNLMFATPLADDFDAATLHTCPDFRSFLAKAGLEGRLMQLGAELASSTVDILGGLPPEAIFFQQSPVPPEEFDDVSALVARMARTPLAQLPPADRDRLLALGLSFIPGIHKMAALTQQLERAILAGRELFRSTLGESRTGDFAFYEPNQYIPALSTLDNILFGRVKTDSEHAQEIIGQSVMQLLIEEDLLETVVEIGMDHQVGVGGDRLSGGQRQKLAIARVLLKKPAVLILDEATSALDNRSQARIQGLLKRSLRGRTTVISVVHRLDTIKDYDSVAVMKAGRIVEHGSYDDLMAKKGALYELVTGRTA